MSELKSFKGTVNVTEMPVTGMITLRGDLASSQMIAAIQSVFGAEIPGIRKVINCDAGQIAWMSPDELLLFVKHAAVADLVAKLRASLEGQHALVEDVSDARVQLRLTGERVREVLAKLMPVDFAPESFAVGDYRRSRLAQIAAAVWFVADDTANLVCFPSFGTYAFDTLSQTAGGLQPERLIG
ncbi:sarcosine oxidase subunit gamma family protein [Cognatishimia sp. WU-CL00825]|uniref:sarcosine oxidase subunit gamma n=1 Tax=Cognatishimia sp. WU-CL00825 TaxID=3127658 RepID=UPI003105C361